MHHWQDIVLSVSLVIFNIALIPSIKSKDKPNLKTSLITAISLLPVLAVYISFSLWYSVVMSSINIILWSTLAIQKLNQDNH